MSKAARLRATRAAALATVPAQRVSQDASRPNPMTIEQKINRARAGADSDIGRTLAQGATHDVGRRRIIPVAGVLAAMLFHAAGQPRLMTLTAVTDTLKTLTPQQREGLGIPGHVEVRYRRILSGFHALLRAIQSELITDHDHHLEVDHHTGEIAACPGRCPHQRLTLDAVATRLVLSSLPPTFQATTAIAIDGTDIESHTRPHRKTLDEEARAFWSADREARWGHRTATDRRPTEQYLGYEANIATFVPTVGHPPIPQLACGLALRPGSTDRAGAALAVIDAITGFPDPLEEVLLDRGYTPARPENLARPLRQRRIAVTMDLHTSQRGVRPGPVPGTIWLDGHLYTDALPQPLRELVPPKPGDTPTEKARLRELFDRRAPYQFVAHGAPDPARGTQRFRGPAVDGHAHRVRCPNTPASMRQPHTLPTTTCTPGARCGCGLTVVVKDTDNERDRQHLPWQSTRWAMSFNRRTLVEGLNAQLRYQALSVNRGFFRVTGLAATTLLLAVTLAGRNLRHLHTWHTVRGLEEPWQAHLGEPVDDRPIDRLTRTRGRRRRPPD